jgi:hypothetical protein
LDQLARVLLSPFNSMSDAAKPKVNPDKIASNNVMIAANRFVGLVHDAESFRLNLSGSSSYRFGARSFMIKSNSNEYAINKAPRNDAEDHRKFFIR